MPSRFFGKKQIRRVAEVQAACQFCREIQSPLKAECIWIQKVDTLFANELSRLEKGAFLLEKTSPPSVISFRSVLETVFAFFTIGCTIYLFYSIRSD